jgi:hypothetical protein
MQSCWITDLRPGRLLKSCVRSSSIFERPARSEASQPRTALDRMSESVARDQNLRSRPALHNLLRFQRPRVGVGCFHRCTTRPLCATAVPTLSFCLTQCLCSGRPLTCMNPSATLSFLRNARPPVCMNHCGWLSKMQ